MVTRPRRFHPEVHVGSEVGDAMTGKLGARVVLLALGLQSVAHAQGFIIPDLGARQNGMGAAVGRPDDLSAMYHNPAALVHLPGTQLGISFGSVFLDLDIRLRPWPGSDELLGDPVDAQGYYPTQRSVGS